MTIESTGAADKIMEIIEEELALVEERMFLGEYDKVLLLKSFGEVAKKCYEIGAMEFIK